MKKLLSIIGLMVFIPLLFISSCKKDKDTDVTPVISTTYNISVVGTVVDINKSPLQNVLVKIGSTEVYTGSDGAFFFSNISVPQSRFVIEFSKIGYFSLSRSAIPSSGANINVEVGLISESDYTYAGSLSFSSSTADSLVMPSDCRIIFPANAFVTSSGGAFSGTANVKAAYLDPTMQDYPMFAFGGDLYGKDEAGNSVMLNPYSGLNVVITDNSGNKLQLDEANGKKATVKMKIPLSLLPSAPDSINLMDYNTTEGLCYASGTATKAGDKYMGQVGHFSFWSCQKIFTGKATVCGTVTDNSGNPVAGVRVHIGRAIGISNIIAITDIDGYYCKVVPAGLNGVVGIFPNYYGTTITPQLFTALTDGETFTANLTVPDMRKVTGKLVKCNGTTPVRGPVTLTWYSYTTYSYVHSACFAKTDGTFTLPMEISASSATIHAWANDTDKVINFTPTTNPYDVGNIILCPPVTVGPTQFYLNGGQFTSATLFSNFNPQGYIKLDTAGIPKHVTISGYGTDGDLWIQVNGISPGVYPVGAKSATIVSLYLMYTTPLFQDTLKTGSVIINRVDPVGGKIEGTFSGTTGTGVSLTNGTFSAIRGADQ